MIVPMATSRLSHISQATMFTSNGIWITMLQMQKRWMTRKVWIGGHGSPKGDGPRRMRARTTDATRRDREGQSSVAIGRYPTFDPAACLFGSCFQATGVRLPTLIEQPEPKDRSILR